MISVKYCLGKRGRYVNAVEFGRVMTTEHVCPMGFCQDKLQTVASVCS